MQQGQLDAALFFSFLLYTVMIGASFGGIASQYASVQKAMGSIEAVLDLLEEGGRAWHLDAHEARHEARHRLWLQASSTL